MAHQVQNTSLGAISDKEGGNMEFKDKKLAIRPLVLAKLPSCGSSDLTY